MSERPVVSLDSVRVRYAKGPAWARKYHDAVREVSVTVSAGRTLGLVGESGSGKSTIGRVCLGLLRPTAGKAQFENEDIFGIGRRHPGALGAVLQHPEWSLDPTMTISESVAEPLRKLPPSERRARVKVIFEQVGLQLGLGSRYPSELSGGQRQRASIARALVTNPRFILFDEAVSALDVSVQAQVLNLIKELQSDTHFAAVFISHDIAVVRYVADEIAVLYNGQIVEQAPANEFYSPMNHPYTRRLQFASGLIDEPDRMLGIVDEMPSDTGAQDV
jgi:ABC-type glutathione transport system ATPase component